MQDAKKITIKIEAAIISAIDFECGILSIKFKISEIIENLVLKR